MDSSRKAAAEGFSRRRLSTALQNIEFVSRREAPSIPILTRLLMRSIVVASGVTARERTGLLSCVACTTLEAFRSEALESKVVLELEADALEPEASDSGVSEINLYLATPPVASERRRRVTARDRAGLLSWVACTTLEAFRPEALESEITLELKANALEPEVSDSGVSEINLYLAAPPVASVR
jgi:hypothetical protein